MVVEITLDLIRKRAEHNEGELTTLKEITLHQYDIEKIQNLEKFCRHLEVLYLQNNQISKIENLSKLKELKYLNLAVNNIQVIENLSRCESLEKLDLTLNFIKDVLCVDNLMKNEFLTELYRSFSTYNQSASFKVVLKFLFVRFLVGNPCTDVPGYRYYVIHTLPQLQSLDGKEISKTERIIAAQEYASITNKLIEYQATLPETAIAASDSSDSEESDTDDDKERESIRQQKLEEKRQRFSTERVEYTPQSRLKVARDLAKLRGTKESISNESSLSKEKKRKKQERPLFTSTGKPLQVNEGKLDFRLEHTKRTMRLVLAVPKFLDSSLLEIFLEPEYIRVTVKGKRFQLVFGNDDRVQESNCVASRKSGDGMLIVDMVRENVITEKDASLLHEEDLQAEALKGLKQNLYKDKSRIFVPPDIAILRKKLNQINIQQQRIPIFESHVVIETPRDFEDNPDVPPLE